MISLFSELTFVDFLVFYQIWQSSKQNKLARKYFKVIMLLILSLDDKVDKFKEDLDDRLRKD